MTFPNEIEKTKKEIEVLTAKLSFLEELKKQKSPVEIAFKDNYGVYPDELKTTDDFNCWNSFRRGYIAAKQEKVSGYEPEPKEATLYDLIADWWDEIFVNGNPSGQNIESLVEKISEWMPDAIVTDIGRSELWNNGYNAYRRTLMGKLK